MVFKFWALKIRFHESLLQIEAELILTLNLSIIHWPLSQTQALKQICMFQIVSFGKDCKYLLRFQSNSTATPDGCAEKLGNNS